MKPVYITLLLALVTAGCGYGSKYNSTSTMGGSGAAISALSPTSTTAGMSGFMLTVSGSSFATNSVIYFNSTPLATNYMTTNQLAGAVPASMVAAPGTFQVYVNSAGTASNMVNFTVN